MGPSTPATLINVSSYMQFGQPRTKFIFVAPKSQHSRFVPLRSSSV